MRKQMGMFAFFCLLVPVMMCGCGNKITEKPLSEVKKGGFNAKASVHDPSIITDDKGNYYIFGSHMEAAKSTDLKTWKSFATGVNRTNPLFDNLFDSSMKAFQFVGKNTDGGYSVWAPDVIYNKKMKKYVMYFCTSSTYVKSNLCFATADKIEGPYHYQDTILYSGFTRSTIKQTNFYDIMPKGTKLSEYINMGQYNNIKWPNCIDPTIFYDADGKMWMVYGSWSGGIFLLEIDEATGQPIHPKADEKNQVDAYFGKRLIGGGHNSIEGPYIMYDPVSEYYYLFVSYGKLESNGGYQIRLFRSKKVDGTYTDVAGKTLGYVVDHSKYGVKMMGNYTFPSLTKSYMAPGHNSAFIDKDGKLYVVYHQRFDDGQEFHEPRVHQMFRTKNGWLAAAPFATNGESLRKKGYSEDEVRGVYYLVNHKTDISDTIHKSKKITLEDEKVTGSSTGSYKLDSNKPNISIQIGNDTYEGVIIEMKDEAGNQTICFSGVSKDNQTIWAVRYK
ncbi:arabinan endo-1,5-alpha-L-arabinosidase [Lachnospiraceae bacterium KM106-2]|nr:arabinan endo-1,5-alpha-L-arabinosidase [Lachnospiraceae bacterium KM106-2]